jgi:hypothetical protein
MVIYDQVLADLGVRVIAPGASGIRMLDRR